MGLCPTPTPGNRLGDSAPRTDLIRPYPAADTPDADKRNSLCGRWIPGDLPEGASPRLDM